MNAGWRTRWRGRRRFHAVETVARWWGCDDWCRQTPQPRQFACVRPSSRCDSTPSPRWVRSPSVYLHSHITNTPRCFYILWLRDFDRFLNNTRMTLSRSHTTATAADIANIVNSSIRFSSFDSARVLNSSVPLSITVHIFRYRYIDCSIVAYIGTLVDEFWWKFSESGYV